MTSYQKLKEKYDKKEQELTQDILTLIDDTNPMSQIEVKMKWRMKLDFEKMVWCGVINTTEMGGIIRHI